jgi:hypothetical protein
MYETSSAGAVRPAFSPAELVIRPFSSIWLGITLATLLFVYCTIGSAIPSVRKHAAIELTEFEWFHWWPFNLLVVLFTVNMIVATLRRVPLRPAYYGVWMVHTGIITLMLGSYYYFTTKIEGDAPVFRRQVIIKVPGNPEGTSLVCLPGNQATVHAGPDRWQFAIQSTNSDWPILSDEHKGEKAYAVNVMVTAPGGQQFVRQILADYPQYTEDVIPGQGRAIKSTGKRLLHDDLSISLEYEPQKYFHVMDTWALFVRRLGETEWAERPIAGLPRYNDRIASRDQVFLDPHYTPPIRPIDLAVPPAPAGDALGSASVHITGYLRYASMQQRWSDGGERLNPVLQVSVLPDQARAETHELIAFDRVRNESEGGMIQFAWFDDFAHVSTLPTDSRALLRIELPDHQKKIDLALTRDSVVGSNGTFTAIDGTEFAYRVVSVQDGLVLPSTGRTVSVAMVDIKTPEGQFTRMVADQPEMTRDMHGEVDPHMPQGRTPQPSDSRIKTFYQPSTAPIIFAAYPKGLHLVVNGPEGRVLGRDVRIAETLEVVPGLRIRADALMARAVSEAKPFVVPPHARQRDARETFSMVRLEINSGGRRDIQWVPFNQYALPDATYAYGGRFAFQPAHFHLSDGGVVEVVFSRERALLPAPIALDHFELDTHIGGYSGQVSTIRNYVSHLRFLADAGWTEPAPIRVNGPTEHGGYWYFQSMWDKPPSNDPTGGMNYTGLGVGNRNGVYIQLFGCCLAVIGMIHAFYLRPILKRRMAGSTNVRAATTDFAGGTPALQRAAHGEPVQV